MVSRSPKLPRTAVSSFVTSVLDVLIEETEVARDRLARKEGVQATSRYFGSCKSLAAILADQDEFNQGKAG